MVINPILVWFFPNASQCFSVILMTLIDDYYVSVNGIVWSVLLRMSLSLDLYIFLLSFFIHHLPIHHPSLCHGLLLALLILNPALLLFVSSIYHFDLQKKLLNALQCGLSVLCFGVLFNVVWLLFPLCSASWQARFIISRSLFADQRGPSVLYCGVLFNVVWLLFPVCSILWQVHFIISRFLSAGVIIISRLLYIMASALHCVPVFVCWFVLHRGVLCMVAR